MSKRRWTWLVLGCFVLALAVAACGDDDDTAGADDDTNGADEGPADEDLPPEVAEARAEAEELGLRFATSREEILEGAEEEGELAILWSLEAVGEDALRNGFEEEYPFLAPVDLGGLDGVEARERFLLEYEAGAVSDLGVNYAATEIYNDSVEMCDWDIYGMAEVGILDIPMEMIDPNNRKVVAAGSTPGIFAYNRDAFEDHELPTDWDELLDPALYGAEAGFNNILADVRLANFSAMASAWGEERTKEYYAEFFENQDPTPVSRFGPFLIQMAQGEYDWFPFVNLHSVWDRERDNPSLGWHIIEPVPVRISETHCVFNDEINNTPYASLLFLEWTTSDGGQEALETGDQPYQSHYAGSYPGGLGELLADYELSVNDFDTFLGTPELIEEIIAAAGFPQPVEE